MSHLDDLPERSSSHVGETESLEAFHRLFKDPMFMIRKEENNDYGVDVEVELLIIGNDGICHPTNIRFHAQLKSSIKDANKDESYSYSVNRTNLNYLLSNPRSIYVFFSRETGQLFFKQAEDVFIEYEKEGDKWHTQDTVTVNFINLLDEQAVKDIHTKYQTESRMERDFRLRMRQQGIRLSGAFKYDPAIEKITDIEAIVDFISNQGLSYAANGYYEELLRLIQKVPESSLNNSAILAKAYASYLQSNKVVALEILRSCDSQALKDNNDRSLLSYLRVTIQKAIGLIDYEKYLKMIQQIDEEYPDTIPAIYATMERLRMEGIRTPDEKKVIMADSLSLKLKKSGPGFSAIAMQAKFVALELKFWYIQRLFSDQIIAVKIKETTGLPIRMFVEKELSGKEIVEMMGAWLSDFNECLANASIMQLDIIMAEGLYVFATCWIQETIRSDKLMSTSPDLSISRMKQLENTLSHLEHANSIYQTAKIADQQARTQLLMVDVYWLMGEREKARNKAKEAALIALREGLVELYIRAESVVKGESPLGQYDALPSIFQI